jgi:hypothetical protein
MSQNSFKFLKIQFSKFIKILYNSLEKSENSSKFLPPSRQAKDQVRGRRAGCGR